MSSHQRRGRSTSPVKTPRSPTQHFAANSEDDSIINTRQLEAFGRTVQATASHLIGPAGEGSDAYRHALSTVQRSLRRPAVQRSVFSLAKANPRELIRANFNTTEIEHRAISYVPDELLRHMPASRSPFSLLEGFKASLPDDDDSGEGLAEKVGRRRRKKMLEDKERGAPGLRKEKDRLDHRLEMMGIRKTMCASEIKEIDDKISNLNVMRRVVLDRLATLEQEEHDMEQEIADVADKIELLEEEEDARAAVEASVIADSPPARDVPLDTVEEQDDEDAAATSGFMSESIYQKIPKANASPARTPKRRKGISRRISMPVLHEHMESGSRIRELQAHNDVITALDFDAPFGTMVTAALDDTVRVWDLNAGRCMGFLEGHRSSVRCLQVEDNIVATGSMDASIRLWDLSQADYNPVEGSSRSNGQLDEDDGELVEASSADAGDDLFAPVEENKQTRAPSPTSHSNSMADCPLFTLEAHVAEITALHFRGSTLVSGSADKTLRQWDLVKGRCVQTLDVLWAAAQASSTISTNPTSPTGVAAPLVGSSTSNSGWWRPTASRVPAAEADFVGALQVFDAALACGTADGMVRLWDLRSGMVHRSLVGHTGPVTALQFDDVFLVTGSRDRSIRIWDLRTGTIHDAYAYDSPISSMQFDARRIVSAAGEDVVKVYDKTDGRHWDCGAGTTFSSSGVDEDGDGGSRTPTPSVVERVRIKDGYLIEGRRDGVVGVWSC